LNYHDKAFITAEAVEAAGAQGAFFEMHDLLYERRNEWVEVSVDQMIDLLSGYAEELDLDIVQFRQDLEEHTYQDKVQSHLEDAIEVGLPGTPSFAINDQPYPYGLSFESLELFIEQLPLLEERRYDNAPPLVIDTANQYFATLQTDSGDVVIELFDEEAPINVNTFVFLAQDNWYDGITFAQVIPDFAAVSGEPDLEIVGHPGFVCRNELSSGISFGEAGVVGIINAGFTIGSSQLFVTLGDASDLDGNYTAIGRVVEGLEILQGLDELDPSLPNPPSGERIQTITIEER
jgi:cyclophilin family peptidyl-prolyl cis-trans isomerase